MRGQRVSLPAKKAKLDLLITAVRYQPETSRLLLAKGFEPVGQVWSDVLLFDRSTLVDRLRSGERVFTGEKENSVAGFTPELQVRSIESDDGELIVAGTGQSNRDDLKVPIF